MRLDELRNKRIAILGVGREGQAAYRWLVARLPDADLTLFAEAPADESFISCLRKQDSLIVEPLAAGRLGEFDVLIRSPGVSPYRDALREASVNGVHITSPSNLWFSAHPGARTICITGTKGKSTTSALAAHLLRSCGSRVALAGNIGLPLLDCADHEVDWWVIELSSYQLADLEATPAVSVILNLSPEHLDWHGDFETYARDKLRLAALAKSNPLILNALDKFLGARFSNRDSVAWFNSPSGIHVLGKELMHGNDVLPVRVPEGLPGLHNLHNVAAALTAISSAGFDVQTAARAVRDFKPLPHRLQLLGEFRGVSYINDSIASTPVSTLAALESLREKPLLLLVGGKDRGLDWTAAAEAFLRNPPRAVIGMPDNGPRILAALRKAGLAPEKGFHEAPDLEQAVSVAQELAEAGEVILLSPGAPSFPQFTDYRDRGQAFARFSGFAPPREA